MAHAGSNEKVPRQMLTAFEAVVAMTDKVCDQHLNEEYKELCRRATAALCRKRPSPLLRGSSEVWACGIAYAMGRINFLFDPSEKPYMEIDELCRAFGVKASTASQKATLVMKTLDAIQMDPKWCLPSRLADNLLAWTVAVDGVVMDARQLPLELQETAFEKGLIPYIPSKVEQEEPHTGSPEDIEVVFEAMDPSEIPPLNEQAEALLKAMHEAGEPLSRRQLLKATGVPISAWSSSLALLMMHDLVEIDSRKMRGGVYGQVYSRKGDTRERPCPRPRPREQKPLPPADSMPFFGMEDQIDWTKRETD